MSTDEALSIVDEAVLGMKRPPVAPHLLDRGEVIKRILQAIQQSHKMPPDEAIRLLRQVQFLARLYNISAAELLEQTASPIRRYHAGEWHYQRRGEQRHEGGRLPPPSRHSCL
jgi:hypothetical protein